MKNGSYIKSRSLLLFLLPLAFIIWCRLDQRIADFYSTRLYPAISSVLSRISSLIPFPLEEMIVIGFVVALIWTVVIGVRRKHKLYAILSKELGLLLSVIIWFYLGWGINYFRSPLPQRTDTPLARYDEDRFKAFLDSYVSRLNETYRDHGTMVLGKDVDFIGLEEEVRDFYSGRSEAAGLSRPRRWQRPKTSLASGLFSKVGVTGSMGPFLSESLLNGDMPETEYPFTFAHEFAHLMGVSSEAEANFWAYRFCESSRDPDVQYSGCFTLLGNIIRNARALLPEEDFKAFIDSIDDPVKQEYNERAGYWSGKYSRILGNIQNAMYNAYLKGNGISSGTRNYDEVVGLLMTDFGWE